MIECLCSVSGLVRCLAWVEWSQCVARRVSDFFFKQKTAYELRISDWSSDVCSSDLRLAVELRTVPGSDAGLPIFVIGLRVIPYASDQIGRASCRERVCQYV